jgi:hypothetical protein
MGMQTSVQSKFTEACKFNLQLPNEAKVLLFHDNTSESLVNILKPAIQESRFKFDFFSLGTGRPYKTIPDELKNKVEKGVDAVIGFFNYDDHDDWSIAETPFRMDIIGLMQSHPIRYAHAAGVTLDMLQNGSFQCDYESMAESGKRLLKLLDDARVIHVTSPRGTDFWLNLGSRMKFETDAVIVPPGIETPGKTGNWPPGEVWLEPQETVHRVGSVPVRINSHGRIVCDMCVGGITATVNPNQPITIEVGEDGWLESYDSPDARFRGISDAWTVDAARWNVQPYTQELGIGLNDRARVGTGNMLEDEKAKGTCHIAIGSYRSHTDFLIDRPAIDVAYSEGSRKSIMIDGKLQMD